jgi:hypothetical protein
VVLEDGSVENKRSKIALLRKTEAKKGSAVPRRCHLQLAWENEADKNGEHGSLDCWNNLPNKVEFCLMLNITTSTVAILVQLASEQSTLVVELDNSVREELEPYKAVVMRKECKVHFCTNGKGFIEAMLDRFRTS